MSNVLLYNTHMVKYIPEATVYLPHDGYIGEFDTQYALLEHRDEIDCKIFYKAFQALKYCTKALIVDMNEYIQIWQSDDPNIIRWYDDANTTLVEIEKELESAVL